MAVTIDAFSAGGSGTNARALNTSLNSGGLGGFGANFINIGSGATLFLYWLEIQDLPSHYGTLTATWDIGGTNQSMTLVGSVVGSAWTLNCFAVVNPTIGSKSIELRATTETGQNCVFVGESFKGTATTSVAAATQGLAGSFNFSTGGTTASASTSVAIPTGDMATSYLFGNGGFTGIPSDGGTIIETAFANSRLHESYTGAGSVITASASQPSDIWQAGIVGIRAPAAGGVNVGRTAPPIFRPRQGPSRGLWTPRSTFIPSGTTIAGQGASVGLATAQATGQGIANSVGATSGVGTVAGVGAASFAGVGASAGIGTVTGIGAGLDAAIAASAGTGTATGVGAGIAGSVAASSGAGTVAGVGAALFSAVGSSAGVGTAAATGQAASNAVGSSAGIGSATGVSSLIPLARVTTWKPGVTYNGGIPNRTTIFTTLSPIGGASDDTAQINTALANAAAAASAGSPQVVLLNAGKYNVNGNGVSFPTHCSYVTLRGSGLPAAMATGGNLANDSLSAFNYVSGTWLVKADRLTNLNAGVIYAGGSPDRIATMAASTDITVDVVKGAFTCTVASASGMSVGQMVLVDVNGDYDPNNFWGNTHDLSGYVNGSTSGSTFTFTSPINGPTGIDGAASASFSGTSMTITSSAVTSYWRVMGVGGGPNPVGTTVFDAGGTFLGYITANTSYPNFTLSQSNSGTKSINVGGVMPPGPQALFDAKFSTFYGFITGGTLGGTSFTLDRSAGSHSGVFGLGGGSRRFFSRQERGICQLMKITNIAGNVLTFETPFHYPFTTAAQAQVTTFDATNYPTNDGVSIENLGVYGGQNADFNGNIALGMLTNSWIKNVESYWSRGGIGLYGCYRCEIRDSFMHETPNPNPGGDGYLCDLTQWSSDNLVENCIMWCGNKDVVMRSCGGGNVLGYNYMTDAFGGTYPMSPEAGANAGHQATTAFALIEGNCSHNFQADAYWGSSVYITVHRNWLTGIRACSPTGDAPSITPCNNLRAYTSVQGATTYPYGDHLARRMVACQAGSLYHNFTGNVLGFSGQTLLSTSSGGFSNTQTAFVYEDLDGTVAEDTNVIIWAFGSMQNSTGFTWMLNSYTTQLRQGNFDWNSGTQKWHGIGGTDTFGGNPSSPFPSIPNSYYLTSKPAFFGGNTWPWVDPASGATATLPAKARFDANTPNVTDVGNVGAASGTGAATAVGRSLAASAAASTGTGAATAVGASLAASVAASAGVGTATGVGSFTVPANVGSSAGVGTATGVGAWTADGIAASAGAGTALGVGQATGAIGAVGSSAGIAIVLGVSPAVELPAGGAGVVMQGTRFTRKKWEELLALVAAEKAAAAKAEKVGSPARAAALAEASGKARDAISALEGVEGREAYESDMARLGARLAAATAAKKVGDAIREAKEATLLAAKLAAEAEDEAEVMMLLDDGPAQARELERIAALLAAISKGRP